MLVSEEPCPLCVAEGRDTVGDNLRTFDSGVQYCIARHKVVGVTKNKNEEEVIMKVSGKKLKTGEYADIKSRNLKKETCVFYGYMINREEDIHIANYYNASGVAVMQQVRTRDKKFPIYGDKSYNETLWGMDKFSPGENKYVTITEGQLDCLSVAQVFDCKFPVVSLPNGASSAKHVLLNCKKWLDGFKHIVLAFDNDAPGKKATEECLKLFDPGKVKKVNWVLKDANEYLKQGKTKELRDAVWNAATYIPDPILTGDNLLKSLEQYNCRTIDWPFSNAKVISPIRVPGIYTVAARPGVGKTEVMSELQRKVIGDGGKIGLVSLEQPIQRAFISLTDALLGTNLGKVTNRKFTKEEVESCNAIKDSIIIYDHIKYGSSLFQIVENLPYMVSLGCDLVIFDNLSYSATGHQGDERRGIDQAMVALKDSTTKYDYTLFNVCHIKREDNSSFKSYSEDDDECPISVDEIRGTQGIEMYSDYIIGLHRDTKSPDPLQRNVLQFYVLKDRFTGQDVGKKFTQTFDPKTRRFL